MAAEPRLQVTVPHGVKDENFIIHALEGASATMWTENTSAWKKAKLKDVDVYRRIKYLIIIHWENALSISQ